VSEHPAMVWKLKQSGRPLRKTSRPCSFLRTQAFAPFQSLEASTWCSRVRGIPSIRHRRKSHMPLCPLEKTRGWIPRPFLCHLWWHGLAFLAGRCSCGYGLGSHGGACDGEEERESVSTNANVRESRHRTAWMANVCWTSSSVPLPGLTLVKKLKCQAIMAGDHCALRGRFVDVTWQGLLREWHGR